MSPSSNRNEFGFRTLAYGRYSHTFPCKLPPPPFPPSNYQICVPIMMSKILLGSPQPNYRRLLPSGSWWAQQNNHFGGLFLICHVDFGISQPFITLVAYVWYWGSQMHPHELASFHTTKLTVTISCKGGVLCSTTTRIWMLTFYWCVVTCGSKNGYRKDMCLLDYVLEICWPFQVCWSVHDWGAYMTSRSTQKSSLWWWTRYSYEL